MKNDPLISIIITCYNQQNLIDKAIESVLQQTYPNWECIVVDDGSTDESADIISKFVQTDDRLNYIYQNNNGVASARNLGFLNAQGEYIQFLDGDDSIDPEKLELQVAHFKSDSTIDVSYTNHRHYFRIKDHSETFGFKELDVYPLEQFIHGWQNGVSLPVHAPIYKRSIWGNGELPYPVDYLERCEDWVFLIMVAVKNTKFAYLNRVLCTYVMHNQNYTGEIGDSCIAAIRAAQYLEHKIPVEFQQGFVADVIDRSLVRYLGARKPDILRASKNWQLGNLMTRPFFLLGKTIKKSIRRQ